MISLPAALRVIGIGCFRNCKALQNVLFEDQSTLERIEECAFEGDSAKITLPGTVRVVGAEAFPADCTVEITDGPTAQQLRVWLAESTTAPFHIS
jgi:hypothetical protein